ncbi:MAG: hypothetical protein JJV99_01285 [Colwellia sp.]|nr:hypothetical protein [Colwellia sp.]
MSQNYLWQTNQQSSDLAEICNALYERELRLLANVEATTVQSVQGRLKSLTYYINRTANMMMQASIQGSSPLILDVQNASWSAKQANKLPLTDKEEKIIFFWYLDLLNKENESLLGLVVPVLVNDHIILDCIDGVDVNKKRIRTNVSGWISLVPKSLVPKGLVPTDLAATTDFLTHNRVTKRLLKPNKKVMLAACAGHCWQNGQSKKLRPIIPSLRELLLSCAINWEDFKQPLAL